MKADKLEQLKGLVERATGDRLQHITYALKNAGALEAVTGINVDVVEGDGAVVLDAADMTAAYTFITEAANALPELLAEIERLTGEREVLHLAICDGEDAPGYAASLSTADIIRVLTENRQTARRDGELAWDGETVQSWKSRALTAEAEIERLRGALRTHEEREARKYDYGDLA